MIKKGVCVGKPLRRVCKQGGALGILLVFFSSCIGISSDISIRQDGSGTIKLEYRVSRSIESLGKLDGNERWPPVPVGRADFERAVARIQGMRLRSFSTKTTEQDMVYRMTLEFSQTAALLQFLDATGGATLVHEQGKNRLSFTLSEGQALSSDSELTALIMEAAGTYTVNLGFSLPKAAELIFLGDGGRPLPAPLAGNASVSGGKVNYTVGLGPLLTIAGPLIMEICW
jgi:hypothetical protein